MPSTLNKQPLVSIIIRTKDRPVLLERAIESVISQTYSNIEVVVINDGGNNINNVINHYRDIVKQVRKKGVSRYLEYIINKTSLGRSSAANVGVVSSKGQYLGFLDDDDYFFSGHVKEHIKALKTLDKKVSFSLATELRTYNDASWRFPAFPASYNKMALLFFDNYFPFNTLMFHRSIVNEIGLFDDNLGVLEDWDFIIRVILNYEPALIKKVTTEFTTRIGLMDNVRNNAKDKDIWNSNFKYIRKKYSKIYKGSNKKIYLKDLSEELNKIAVERRKYIHKYQELAGSLPGKVYKSNYYQLMKKIARMFKLTRN